MAISESEIAQVRSATDIVALISETVALKKSGRRWTGLCPFHGEKTPSFSVNAEEGRYYCFGCRASGDQDVYKRQKEDLSHYSRGTTDVEFVYPWGWDELEGVANRGDYDLTQHANASGVALDYFDQTTNERYTPCLLYTS